MKITFHGASGLVTGSCYLVETESTTFLVDCGMFQGLKDEHYNSKFNFDPKQIDFVLLTHAHIDHSGLIPKLFREGFKGKVFSTIQTFEISELLLKDSASIQESNYLRGRIEEDEKLYDTKNALDALSKFETLGFDESNEYKGIKFRFVRAGHVLGAASIVLEAENKKIVFSGDIGREEQSLIRPYDLIDEDVDYVVMESLYGGSDHPSREESINKLLESTLKIVKRNGNVTVPSFALHRSQEMMLNYEYLIKSSKLDPNVHIFLDGPLAESITKIYSQYQNLEVFPQLGYKMLENLADKKLFSYNQLTYVREHRESTRLMRKSKRIILAGSGMCTGGRIMNHLRRGLKKGKNGMIFVGYQAEGTLGRKIVEGAKQINVNNKNVNVKAEIFDLKGFSAHAGNKDLLNWFENKKSDRLKKVFLTHADPEKSEAFKEQIVSDDYDVIIPNMYDSYEI